MRLETLVKAIEPMKASVTSRFNATFTLRNLASILSSLHSYLHGIIMFVYHHIGCLYSYFSKLRFYSVLVCLCYCVPCTFLSLVEGILEIHSIERNYFDRWNQNYLFERESKKERKKERKKFSHMEFIVFNWWNG